ncbi:hypothetical protein HHL11_30000 [Ramlibacter sp. G-1-2-2]|uniref:Homing endonuclease LAGLIDADG domain-containing protein n=1 Tax=Ramlibacter agri TaxID=2728837 RepID=A0A848HEY0_9BURK|nr:hypothetical protein [Ramlibacter agri]NML48019.1 hypothetical protein [Ramlibacter agri]
MKLATASATPPTVSTAARLDMHPMNLDGTAYGVSQARSAASTVDEMLATVGKLKKPFLMSPYSKCTTPNEADIGWAAGILDGEGCIHIARQKFGKKSGRRPVYRLRVQIAQTSRTLLEEFEWVVGICGTIAEPPVTKKQRRRCYSLIYDGLSAYAVMERLVEHLRRKRVHVVEAKNFRRECAIHVHPGPHGHSKDIWKRREWYYNRMRALNRGEA